MASAPPTIEHNDISPVSIVEEMKTSYLDYAMSVIVSRALPDVRDGLKPVHRRILYACQEGGFVPGRPYRKSAKIVGDVMGNYHPHGERARRRLRRVQRRARRSERIGKGRANPVNSLAKMDFPFVYRGLRFNSSSGRSARIAHRLALESRQPTRGRPEGKPRPRRPAGEIV